MAQRAGSFFAKPMGTAMAKRIGICANTVHAPCSTMYQKSYHSVPSAAIAPSSPVFLQTMDTATVRPKNANRMTGVYIAPPNRCMFCMKTSLLSDMSFISSESSKTFVYYNKGKSLKKQAFCAIREACTEVARRYKR